MKKLSKWLIAVLCAVMLMAFFCACTPTKPSDAYYNVTFNLGYENAPSAQELKVTPGEKVAKPTTDPTRDNYTFDAWYTEVACINEYNFDSEITGNITLFAGWIQTEAIVTYYTYGGTVVDSETVHVGETLTSPTNPIRDGYVFAGWYTEPLCRAEYKYDFSSKVTNNLTLYAKWAQTEAIVSLVLYDDVTTDPMRVELGGKLPIPETPNRENYAFTTWYVDAQRTVEYDFNSVVNDNFTLYAGWKLTKATVTYNFNYEDAPEANVALVDVDVAITQPNAPIREGYEFIGWYTDSACTKTFDFNAGVGEDTALYAGWELKTYTVTFDWNFDNETEAVEVEVKHGATVNTPEDSKVPTNGSKVFVGWTLDAEGTQEFDYNTSITSDMTLYAKWMEASSNSITVTFYMNDGTNAVHHKLEDVRSGSRIKEPTQPVRKGYYLAGWAMGSADGALWNFTRTQVKASTNLYAVWLKGYSFEAEYTELAGKYYAGWSNDGPNGSASVFTSYAKDYDNADEMKVSGGVYVYNMLYNGAFLEFNVTAQEAVDNAVLVLRLAPDGYNFELNDETYQVLVNGKRIQYGSLCVPIGKYQTDDMNDRTKPPFFNYIVTISLALNKGENVIKLLTNNTNEHGGTFAAETPVVDCITIYSEKTLTWTPGKYYPGNVEGMTADKVTYAVEYEGDFRNTGSHYDSVVKMATRNIDYMTPRNKEEDYE